jgi:LysR family transcriptional regulator, glycine cleavage system transcriptional activator
MRPLPPFDGLVALDATLRHGSVTRAAEELGLTQSAVSHRLSKLEAFVGVPLLVRTPGGVAASPAGSAMATELGSLLDAIAALSTRGQAAVPKPALRIGVGAALAQHWLVPRLPAFTAAHPEIAVELIQFESEAGTRGQHLDLTIHWEWAERVRATSTQRVLMREKVFPVCHPSLLKDGRTLRDPRRLAAMPLLHKGRAGDDRGVEWSWSTWFDHLGLGRAPRALMRFDSIATTIAAALRGQGMILARTLLVADALAEGRLVRVLPGRWDMRSSKVQVVRWSGARSGEPRVRTFVRWAVACAEQ